MSNPAVLFLVVVAIAFLWVPGTSQRLPVRTFSVADGLASSVIHNVTRDSAGFLWFCARGGLSRYDGAEFTTYEFGDDPSPTVEALLETRDRTLWIAAADGLYRVDRTESVNVSALDEPRKAGVRRLNVQKVTDRSFRTLFEDSAGRLWGGGNGLFQISDRNAEQVTVSEVPFSPTADRDGRKTVRAFVETPDTSLWVMTFAGAVRRLPDGRWVEYLLPRISEYEEAYSIRSDNGGRVWLSHSTGVYVLKPESVEEINNPEAFIERNLAIEDQRVSISSSIKSPARDRIVRLRFEEDGESNGAARSADSSIRDIYASDDGKVWLPSAQSLYLIDGDRCQRLKDSSALPGTSSRIEQDLSGNLWFGTFGGVVKYVRNGLITYDQAGGLEQPIVHSVQQARDGRLLVSHGTWMLSTISPEGIKTTKLNMPGDSRFTWTSVPVFVDDSDMIWALSDKGLYRIPLASADSNAMPVAGTSVSSGFWYRAFAARGGDIWFATRNVPASNFLLRFSPGSGSWTNFSDVEGFPKGKPVASFAEDAVGNSWFGFYGENGMVRLADGRFKEFGAAEGVPNGAILDIKVDQKGRLWAATTETGVFRIDNPGSSPLSITRFSETEGLAANNVRTIALDSSGNAYAGTLRGISRIDAATGEIRNFTTADGVAADFVHSSFRDKDGSLWFGTANGLSRLDPRQPESIAPPQVYIGDLQIAGKSYSISEFGQVDVRAPEVSASENNLQISYFAIGNAGTTRYQYRLEGATQSDWSEPTSQRSVNFSSLSPGSYRFAVRASNEAGAVSKDPAVVAFTIRPPFWRTWWFLMLAFLVIAGSVFALDRYRVSKTRQVQKAFNDLQRSENEKDLAEKALEKAREDRIAELQRVRSRIATDLHDDVGSSLTQISLYSELARQQRQSTDAKNSDALDLITNISNEMVDTMSDIVWAINPKKDHLPDLIQRMRRFAADTLSAREIDMDFVAPQAEADVPLGANIRREVFLIFKETINNIAKHSQAANVRIELGVDDKTMILRFEDNGCGFEAEAAVEDGDWKRFRGGNGLANMKRRASDLGGLYSIESRPGSGTTATLTVLLEQDAETNFPT